MPKSLIPHSETQTAKAQWNASLRMTDCRAVQGSSVRDIKIVERRGCHCQRASEMLLNSSPHFCLFRSTCNTIMLQTRITTASETRRSPVRDCQESQYALKAKMCVNIRI